jgi:hypothetical protein
MDCLKNPKTYTKLILKLPNRSIAENATKPYFFIYYTAALMNLTFISYVFNWKPVDDNKKEYNYNDKERVLLQ